MAGGARDFNIKIDGRVLGNNKKDFKVYKDVLWKNANELGFFHLEENGFGKTDPYHIGLVKEKGDGTAFKRLFIEYPELTKDKNVQDSLADLKSFQKKNPKDTTYSNIIEAFDSVKPLTGEEKATANRKERYTEREANILKNEKSNLASGGAQSQESKTSSFKERYLF